MKKHKTIVPVGESARAALAALVADEGEDAVIAKVGCSRSTLARVLAGLPVNRGTANLVQVALSGAANG